ncbi:MAG TPA: hypothetical protein VFX96_16605 [Pyrinomonadaceae bacterium]|nr:hypothetical protein [Pyrinomonadaceae bacterium]
MILCNQCGQQIDNDLNVCLECFADPVGKPQPSLTTGGGKSARAASMGGAPTVTVGTKPASGADDDDDAPTIVGTGRLSAEEKRADETSSDAASKDWLPVAGRWKRIAVGFVVATSVLAVALAVSLVRLYSTGSRMTREQDAKQELELRNSALASKLSTTETKLRETEAELLKTNEARKTHGQRWPLIVTDLRLLSGSDSSSASEFSVAINWYSTRKIFWRATLQNNLAGIESLSGNLCVKFIRPSGTVYADPSNVSGCTLTEPISLADRATFTATTGYSGDGGSSFYLGPNRVELWWGGQKIGEKAFHVTE